jgi:hypothetical protein
MKLGLLLMAGHITRPAQAKYEFVVLVDMTAVYGINLFSKEKMNLHCEKGK